jgi:cytochrome bd-type quinol oxidase subunit 2
MALVFPIASFLAIFASLFWHRRRMAGAAFLTSALSLYAMICSAAAGPYPYVLPARIAQYGLTTSQVASSPESLTLALYWWIPGMILVAVYTFFVYTKFLPTGLTLTSKG